MKSKSNSVRTDVRSLIDIRGLSIRTRALRIRTGIRAGGKTNTDEPFTRR